MLCSAATHGPAAKNCAVRGAPLAEVDVMPAWIAWMLATLVSWGIWASLPRLLDPRITPAQAQALSTFGILPVLLVLARMPAERVAQGRPARGMALALASGLLSALGNVAFYAALRVGPSATINALIALAPLVTVVLAVPILKERLNALQCVGILLSILALFAFYAPNATQDGARGDSSWLVLSLVAIVLFGTTALLQKAATNDVSARAAAIGFLLAFLPLGAVIQAIDPLAGASARDWVVATGIGFTLALGNFTILKAFALDGNASIIGPMSGLFPLVSIPIGLVAFGDQLGVREATVVALALTAVVLLSKQTEPLAAPAITRSELE
jgi:drug/metabolite transporter (DMT)-like permease